MQQNNNFLDDLILITKGILKPYSSAKWLVKNQKIDIAIFLFVFPVFIVLLLSFVQHNIIINLLRMITSLNPILVLILVCLFQLGLAVVLSYIISVTSDNFLGKEIPFKYIFCALSSRQLVRIPCLFLICILINLSSSGSFFYAISFLFFIGMEQAATSLQVFVFGIFGINKNRLILWFGGYTILSTLLQYLIIWTKISSVFQSFNPINFLY